MNTDDEQVGSQMFEIGNTMFFRSTLSAHLALHFIRCGCSTLFKQIETLANPPKNLLGKLMKNITFVYMVLMFALVDSQLRCVMKSLNSFLERERICKSWGLVTTLFNFVNYYVTLSFFRMSDEEVSRYERLFVFFPIYCFYVLKKKTKTTSWSRLLVLVSFFYRFLQLPLYFSHGIQLIRIFCV